MPSFSVARPRTLYLAAILNACMAPGDGARSWRRPAAESGTAARPITPPKRRFGRLANDTRGR
jgi:hypothetical protein